MEDKIFKISIAALSLILLFGVFSLYYFWNPSDFIFFPKCPMYSFTGLYCPGCGSQRGIHQILNGNIIEGFRHNYLLLLMFIVLGYKFALYIFKKIFNTNINNLLHRPITTKLILVFVILFWILRNINLLPFRELAP